MKVEIVVQFFKVGEIDTLKEQFNADVVVKAKWREPTLDGQQTTVSDNIDIVYGYRQVPLYLIEDGPIANT